MSAMRLVFVAVLAVAGAGCINSAALITVKPDGSGTIEHTMLVNLAAVKGLMASMGAPGGAEARDTSTVMNEAEFKRSAERMGVRPVSLTPVKNGAFEGAKAVYAFDDIRTVRVDQDPQMSGASGGRFSSAPSSRSPITFGLAREGGQSVLTVKVDEKAADEATARAERAPDVDAIDPAMMQMLKTVFDGFKILIDLQVDGTIVKTNADYVTGSRVTLLELDLGRVLAEPSQLKTLQSKVRPGASLSELRPHLKAVPGVKVNHPNVTIAFR